jgi:hypothetical protein
MATHKELVDEGNRLDAALGTIQRIALDAQTIPEQLAQVKRNGDAKAARLKMVRKALDMDCTFCAHPKKLHVAGMGECKDPNCMCREWLVDV